MLARQEEYTSPAAEQPISDREAMRREAKKPLFNEVLDTKSRSKLQILFVAVTVLAMLVAFGSGMNASRGYELIAVQKQAAQLEQENERLRIDIAKLKSPERIKTIAEDQLGMEVPRQTYFAHEK